MLAILSPQNHNCDKAIWNSFKNGDTEAFSKLYCKYVNLLIRNCNKLTSDRNLIEDCIHDLFFEIWSNKVNLATPESVKAYLLCSIQRKIIRQIKQSRKVQFNYDVQAGLHTVRSIEDKIIWEQDRQEKERNINIAIGLLTKRQKEAVFLKYYENLSYSEIALRMTISTDAVYNLISKALDNIRVYKQLERA